jgi:outer membrane protein OmpA-like peptidoglycan-associated protein
LEFRKRQNVHKEYFNDMIRHYLILLLVLLNTGLWAQKEMRVIRCDAVSDRASIQNIFIDEENRTWIGNEEGVFEVLDQSLGKAFSVAEGKIALYAIPGGNAPLLLDKAQLEREIGFSINGDSPLTAAYYRPTQKELWLGSQRNGAFRLRAEEGSLRLLDSYNSKNSKLKTDQINTIFVDPFGNTWIGTNDGIFFGKDNKWDLEERYFNFTKIGIDFNNRIWLLADDLLGYMNRKDVWTPVDMPEGALDGPIIDFTFDPEGFLWVVTEIVARIDLESEDYTIYGPAQYYTSQFANQIESDLDGAIWVGTEDKGLFLIESATAMTVNVVLEKGLDCDQAGNTAALSVRISGGTAPYEYTWAEGKASGANPTDLGEGTYIVTVTDSRGTEKIAKAEITDPRVLAEATMLEKESGLNEQDGRAEVSVSQGLAPYTYEWDNGERTQTAVQLSEGMHQVTVTDKNGCQTVAEVKMERVIGALSASIQQQGEIKCYGEKTVSLSVETAGGKGPFTYEWSNGATTASLANLGAGKYEVTVSDVLGNQTASSIEITQPEAFTAAIEVLNPPSVGRRDGAVTVQLTGGNGPFIYKWSNEANRDTTRQLAPGPISITVTDVTACKAEAEVVLQENILALGAEVNYSKEIQCFGQPAASFTIEPVGGKGPYQYEWSASTVAGNEGLNQFAGDYSVTITDGVGQTFVKNFTIPQPDKLEVETSVTQPATANGSDGTAVVKVTGGKAPYTYQWSNGNTQPEGTDLAAGLYSITVTDANGCETLTRVEMTETILDLRANIEIEQEVKCGGDETGVVNVQPVGGKSPYSITWRNRETDMRRTGLSAGIYYATLTDVVENTYAVRIELKAPPVLKGKVVGKQPATTDQEDGRALIEIEGGTAPYQIKWSSGETGDTAVALAPGDQQVIITDSIGCMTEVDFSLDEDIQPLVANLEIEKPVTCSGESNGILKAALEGGKGPFTFAWSAAGQTEQTAGGLSGGEYSVTVTDAIGQTSNATISLPDPTPLSAEITRTFPASQVNETDGYAMVEVQGGVEPYQYAWDNGETTAEAIQLKTGVHRVEVTDANGCTVNNTDTLPETLIPGLSFTNIELNKRIPLTNIKFQPDSTDLEEQYHPVMAQLFKFLTYQPGVSIELGGHTNSLPPDEYCDKISRARAKATADYLLKRDIPIYRVFYKGYGKRDPIADNDTPEGRLKNQRVELKVISNREVKEGSD